MCRAVACDHPVVAGGDTYRADALLQSVPAQACQQISCGSGAKGHRYYHWAFIHLDHDHDPAPGQQQDQYWLMIRRDRKTTELAFYRCSSPNKCNIKCDPSDEAAVAEGPDDYRKELRGPLA